MLHLLYRQTPRSDAAEKAVVCVQTWGLPISGALYIHKIDVKIGQTKGLTRAHNFCDPIVMRE